LTKETQKKTINNLKDVLSQKTISLAGVANNTAKAFFVINFLLKLTEKRAIFWLCRDEKEKEEIIENLNFWRENQSKKISLFDLRLTNGKTLFFIKKSPGPEIYLGTAEDIEQKVPDWELYEKHTINLRKGEKINPAKLSQKLIKIGYQFDRYASSPTFFSRQGGIIDIYPENYSQPLKLEFNGQEIEKIISYDPKSKKKINELKEAIIIPAKLEFLKKELSLIDFISKARDKDDFLLASDPKLNFEKSIFQKLKNFKHLFFYSLEKRNSLIFDFVNPFYFYKNFEKLAKEIKNKKKEKFKIIIATKKKKAIEEFAKNYNIAHLVIKTLPNRKIKGFLTTKNKILFLTDKEIFGEEEEKNEFKNKRTSFELIYELKPNDYVVHLDHGIGRFLGIIKRKINNHEKEYFSLAYAENDKLFVPIENADKITKYIGEAKPKLHRLSGTSWLQTTYKIKKSAEKTAQELIKLYAAREIAKAVPLKEFPEEEKELAASFKYEETPDQIKAITEVLSDLKKTKPTDRLICGDVGFGKTEVAVRAAYRAFLNRKQVALLAPTTLLTQQHYDTFKCRLKNFGVNIALLSRVQSLQEQKAIITKLKTGLINIVIGTHRLLSPDIKFKDLALIIIDEEQRFGVKDKEKLKSLRSEAHILTLSATPIPRTLNFSLSGLRDISLIQTPPQGRKSVETHILPFYEKTITQAIREELKRKGQVYYLHNRVQTINIKAKHIQKLVPEAKVDIAHGQLNEKELMEAMRKFDNQETNVLVCSTIIENGLDLPNANTLIVENATSFGLGDLYQLRGRIGRSDRKAYAYFFYNSRKLNQNARKRLGALLEAKELGSGFQLALRDLQIRGSGNILGHKQSGHIKAIGLNLYIRLLNQAINEAKTGHKQKEYRDVVIDLPLSIGIPSYVIPQEPKRLKVYQEMANFLSVEELEKYRQNFKKKYEQEPEEVKNLFALLKLKITAQKAGITHISHSKINIGGLPKEKITLTFSGKIDPEKIGRLMKENPAWDFTESQIKIDKAALGEKWLDKLTEYVKILM